jgi:hypothetical protein
MYLNLCFKLKNLNYIGALQNLTELINITNTSGTGAVFFKDLKPFLSTTFVYYNLFIFYLSVYLWNI